MSSRLSPVLSVRDLPAVELQAARLDGELYRVDECFSPIDEIEGTEHRARALATTLPERLIAEQHTAAWILGAIDSPPRRHRLCAAIGARGRAPDTARFIVREVVIDESELLSRGGMRLTTPLRTAIDLARFCPAWGEAESAIVTALMVDGRFGIDDCARNIDRRRNLPGKQRALERLGAVSAPVQH
jgi:hypothetical protein